MKKARAPAGVRAAVSRKVRVRTESAERAVRLPSKRNWMMLDVLGVAYAEQGKFTDAVSMAQRALALAQSGPGAGAAPELQQHLALFEAGRPLRSR